MGHLTYNHLVSGTWDEMAAVQLCSLASILNSKKHGAKESFFLIKLRIEYTREIGRIGGMCADYESLHYQAKVLKFKSPLISTIEKELEKRSLKQRQAAEFLDVKESTFSQIMTGKRTVSMRMAKRLYEKLNIDPGLILKYG